MVLFCLVERFRKIFILYGNKYVLCLDMIQVLVLFKVFDKISPSMCDVSLPCANPERFVRGDPTLISFFEFDEGREDPKYH